MYNFQTYKIFADTVLKQIYTCVLCVCNFKTEKLNVRQKPSVFRNASGPEGRKRLVALSAAGSSLTLSPAPVHRKHRQKKCATGDKVSAHALGNPATHEWTPKPVLSWVLLRRGQPFAGSSSSPKKRKTVPLQLQFLYINVHKLSGT